MKKYPKQPWPTKEAMIQVYEKNLWGGESGGFIPAWGRIIPRWYKPIYSSNSFLKPKTPPVVCDLGCGDFNVGKELLPFAKEYKAIDIVPALMAHNKQKFKKDNLTFYTLDIAKDALPAGDCAIVRQVLQHLSNAEIKAIVEKLYQFKYVILTEHLPEGVFEPNTDIISGQGIRLKKQSGVKLLAAPFHFKVKEEKELLAIPSPDGTGNLVTTLYRVF